MAPDKQRKERPKHDDGIEACPLPVTAAEKPNAHTVKNAAYAAVQKLDQFVNHSRHQEELARHAAVKTNLDSAVVSAGEQ